MNDMPEPFNAREMRKWWEDQIIEMAKKMSRTAVSTRINSLSKGLDVWAKLYRLENDTATVEELAQKLEELEQRLKGGPVGIVNGQN
jgi:hypothetical protein